MQVVFLCGGAGKRMFPLTEDKFLVKFVGRPLLEHQIEQALAVGLGNIILVGNRHNIQRVQDVARRFPQAPMAVVNQGHPSGMADALRSAEESIDDEFIVVGPSDVFAESGYRNVLAESSGGSASAYLLGARVDRYFPGGYLVVDEINKVRRIVEKPGEGAEPSNVVNIVVHLHSDARALFQHMAKVADTGSDAYEQALQSMIDDGHDIKLVEYGDNWHPIKYPWHLLDAMEYFLDRTPQRIAPSATISDKATIEGKAILDDNVRVLENAVVRGPCYVGRNTVVGNNALIRDGSHIGADCVIGYSTEIKHSYVGDGCWLHHNYIGDSVIGDGCSFGAGTVTANLRFDEGDISVHDNGGTVDTGLAKLGAIVGAGSKTGVNVSIMPGVRIGPYSVVGPHVLLSRDLEPNTMLLLDGDNRLAKKRLNHGEGVRRDA